MTIPNRTLPAISLAAALALAGCATTDSIPGPAASAAQAFGTRPPAHVPPGAPSRDAEEPDRAAPILVPGSDLMIATPSRKGAISGNAEAISLRFEQAPVTEVVHAVFGDLLKVDYAIVTPLTGEITIHTQAPVARDQVFGIMESLLQANNIAMVRDAAGRYQIGSAAALRGSVPLPGRAAALPAGAGSVIVPLQYISASEMAEILRPVANESALLRVDTLRNLLILAGTRNQIEGWLEIINTFDVDFLKGLSVGLFPLTHASVNEMESTLQTMFGGSGGQGGGTQALGGRPLTETGGAPRQNARAQAPGAGGGIGSAGSAGAPGGMLSATPLAGLVRILPIERLNALLVITARAHYLELAREWIERFDRPDILGNDARLYIYPVQNGSAQHLAGLLSALYGTGESAGTTTQSDSGVAPALGSTSLGSASLGQGFSGSTAFGTSTQRQSGSAEAQTSRIDLDSKIRVIADTRNNALLIHANGIDYRRLLAALRQLDIAPVQVLIEASIAEVTLTDGLEYGLQWYFHGGIGGGRTGQGQLTRGGSGDTTTTTAPDGTITTTTPAAAAGFSWSVIGADGSIRAVLNLLAEKSLLNVISSPSVMVLDNHTATIQVGDQQPVQSSTTVTDGGNTSSYVTYKDTGVQLSVTPSVNAGDMVTMLVDQAVIDVGAIDQATGQRSFLQRQVSSRVAVRSGETIVLGGLIRDNKTRSRQGLPLLHDIPVLGHLFGSTSITADRTELLLMITPRVVRTEQDVRQTGAEIRERMRGLRSLIEKGEADGRFGPAAQPAPDTTRLLDVTQEEPLQ